MHLRTLAIICFVALAQITGVLAQGTAFTYQGRLQTNGVPYTGSAEFQFTLWDAASAGTSIAASSPASVIAAVENGLFTVTLDFGRSAFNGEPRFLQIDARTTLGPFTTLTPRQPLTSTPYALRALNSASATTVSGNIPATQITGIVPLSQLPVSVITNGAAGISISGTFSGDGAGVSNLNLALNSGGTIAQSGGFALASSPSVGLFVSSIALTDVNSDAAWDVVSADYNSGTLRVMTNNGRGDFVVSSSPNTGGGRISSVIAADVNGDNRPDLISAHFETSSLRVSVNNGSAGFAPSFSITVGSFPISVTSADVNGDGKADLISANQGSGGLTILTNNGSSGFAISSSLSIGRTPAYVGSTDLNGDGKPDLFTANDTSATLTVLTNNGNGSFVLSSSPSVGDDPAAVTAADVNNDGRRDLIAASKLGPTLTVLTNQGGGNFALSSSPSVGNSSTSVTTADVNGDGHADVIRAHGGASLLTVLTNDGHGAFILSSSLNTGNSPIEVESADLNGDGLPDLISGNFSSRDLTVLLNATVFTGKFVGDGSALIALPAEQLTGTVPDTRLPANVAFLDRVQTFTAAKTFNNGTFNGNGAGLTALNASQLSSGTVPDARLSTNVALHTGGNIFSGNQVVTNGTLRIGNGTAQSQVQFGTTNVGTGVAGVNTFTIGFPAAFSTVPKVFVTAKGNDTVDTFAISTRAVTTTGFKVNIIRVDTAIGWGQPLQVDWYAVQ